MNYSRRRIDCHVCVCVSVCVCVCECVCVSCCEPSLEPKTLYFVAHAEQSRAEQRTQNSNECKE